MVFHAEISHKIGSLIENITYRPLRQIYVKCRCQCRSHSINLIHVSRNELEEEALLLASERT